MHHSKLYNIVSPGFFSSFHFYFFRIFLKCFFSSGFQLRVSTFSWSITKEAKISEPTQQNRQQDQQEQQTENRSPGDQESNVEGFFNNYT
jgi:hypothetical protein